MKEMATNEVKETRKQWTREETLLFLHCYSVRKEEFQHSRKKKFAYANVLEDVISQGFSDTSATTKTLEGKMRTLLQAYKSAKDNKRQTGAAHCQAQFQNEMDEIFGRERIISNEHTLNLGTEVQRPLQESRSSVAIEPSSFSGGASSANSASVHGSNAAAPLHSVTANVRKRKSAKEIYYAQKLELNKKFYSDLTEIISKKLNPP